MAAVMAAVHAPHSSVDESKSVQSSPGFTAVNGRETSTNTLNGPTDSPSEAGSTIKVAIDRWPLQVNRNSSSRPTSPPPPPPMHHGNGHHIQNGDHAESPGLHKRKRSQSDEPSNSVTNSSRAATTASTSPTNADVRSTGQNAAPELPNGVSHDKAHDLDHNGHQYPQSGSAGHIRAQSNGQPWYSRGGAVMQVSNTPHGGRLDEADMQMAEELRRENHDQEASHRSWGVPARSEGESVGDSPYAAYSQENTSQGSGQIGPKRKRVFSNRTKTGCQTCRSRKKKCDEQHPECNNCLRGGFTCQGYNIRGVWPKPPSNSRPVPLQSKDVYGNIIDDPYRPDDESPRQGRSSLNRQGARARPIVVEDGEHMHHHFTASPTSAGPGSRGSHPGQSHPGQAWPPNATYIPDHHPNKDYRDLPPFSEIARTDPSKPEYTTIPPMRDMRPMHSSSQPQPGPSAPAGQWQTQPPQVDHRPSYAPPPLSYPPPHLDTSSPQNTARMALSIEQQQSALRSEDTEKGKMMRGHPFRFSDSTLMADRERCRAALSRYNNAASSADAASFQLLKQILVPSATGNGNGNGSGSGHGHGYGHESVYSRGSGNGNGKDKLIGYLAPGVIVETPFKCHYGYNIKLSEDVYVGENCTIIDAFGVTIGSKTSLGPNVTIITGGPGRDLVDRQGTNSIWIGKPVVIEGEVLVGAGVVIHPGVTLGRGCTIEAGAVVMSSVDANQTVGAGEIYRRA